MRKISFCKKIKADVLIYDISSSRLTQESIPREASIYELDIRNGVPMLVSISYLIRLVRYLIKEKNLSKANYFAIFDEIDPMVIITFSTMTDLLAKYSELRPEKLVIGIQTAVRPENFTKTFMRRAASYYVFGKAELDLCEVNNIPIKEPVLAGSYQLGIYMSSDKNLPNNSEECWDLCFVSGYRKEFDYESYQPMDSKANWGTPEEWLLLRKAHEDLFALVARYAYENSLSLLIVGRQRDETIDKVNEQERSYFENRAGQSNFEIICDQKHKLSSYRGAMYSQLVIHLYSTLGWEFLGLGKRVLFGGGIDPGLVEIMDVGYWTKFLPALIHLTSPSYDEFQVKANELMNMSLENYTNLTKCPAEYYMNHDTNNPPHKVIGKRIQEHLVRYKST